MTQANQGDTVKIHFTCRLIDCTKFASSYDHNPVEFKIGGGQIFSGIETGNAWYES